MLIIQQTGPNLLTRKFFVFSLELSFFYLKKIFRKSKTIQLFLTTYNIEFKLLAFKLSLKRTDQLAIKGS